MKPFNINLAAPRKTSKEILLGVSVILIFAAATLSSVTLNEYMANRKVISVSQNWIKETNQKREQQDLAARKALLDPKELEGIKKEFLYLEDILKKTRFSLPMVLSEIEKIKPERVNINEVAFGKNPRVIIIKGQSGFVTDVSAFLTVLEKSSRFSVELLKEEINEQRQISFELMLEWMELQDGQKI